ncbi:MAG: alpha/beta hydrolase [Bacillota bacterium]
MWEQKYYGLNNQIVGVEEYSGNSKRLLLMLTGLGQSMSGPNFIFSTIRKELALDGEWVIQFDYRGCGDSQGDLSELSITSMVNDTIEVLTDSTRDNTPEVIYLLGDTLGAIVAQYAALAWEKLSLTKCIPILISPPLDIKKSEEIFNFNILRKLCHDGQISTNELLPGQNYYTLEDFTESHILYIESLGGKLMYLHGQNVSADLINELDSLNPVELCNLNRHGIHVIHGEFDMPVKIRCLKIKGAVVHSLRGVKDVLEHPDAIDQLTMVVRRIVCEGGVDS